MKFSAVALAAATTQGVAAHYYFGRLILNGKWTDQFEYVRETLPEYDPHPLSTYNNRLGFPMFDATDVQIRCGRNATLPLSPVKTATLHAGETVGFGIGLESYPIIHPGFGSAWLSKAPEGVPLDQYEGDGDWFKFMAVTGRTEQSLDFDNDPTPRPWDGGDPMYAGEPTWGTTFLDSYNFTIPKTTPAGRYLLRWEHIYPRKPQCSECFAPQFYVNCAHVEILNDGPRGTPGPLVKLPGVYTFNQPDLSFASEPVNSKDVVPPKPDVWSG